MNSDCNRSSSVSASGQLLVSSIENAKSQRPATAGVEPVLLLMRMEALQLDPEHVKAAAPDVFRVLARVCDYCQCTVRCERDLVYEMAGKAVAWEDYCPNAFRLNEMAPRSA